MIRNSTIECSNKKKSNTDKKIKYMLGQLTEGNKHDSVALKKTSNKKQVNELKGKLFKAIKNDFHDETVFH